MTTFSLALWLAAAIEGRLANPVTGAPVRKANVVVGTTRGVQVKRAVSDVNGHYAVDGLPAGRYRVAAGKAGFLTLISRSVVVLREGETRRDVNLAMETPAVISGHCADEEGEPVERATIVALRQDGARVVRAAVAETDDRGEYRLPGLTAGRYIVRASHATALYAPVFYPAAADFHSAAAVNVARGSEARAIDIRLTRSLAGGIGGVVHGPAGLLPTVRVARLSTDAAMSALPDGEVTALPDGRFLFPKLAQGTYVVSAHTDAPFLWSSQTVSAGGGTAETELTLAPGRELDGEINVPVAVILTRVNGFRSEARSEKLRFANITPGTWELRVAALPPDSYVESVRWGERERVGLPLEIGTGELPKLRIKIGEAGGTVEGDVSLTAEAGGAVLEALADEEGRYQIRGIRPGRYTLACTGELLEIKPRQTVKRDCQP